MPTPHEVHTVGGSWLASLAGWAYSLWHWFAGDASGMSVLIGVATISLTAIKIAQEINAWRSRDEERQALRKLWDRMSRRTRPGRLDSRID